ncbi:unnamed protein product [Lampetra planeri]
MIIYAASTFDRISGWKRTAGALQGGPLRGPGALHATGPEDLAECRGSLPGGSRLNGKRPSARFGRKGSLRRQRRSPAGASTRDVPVATRRSVVTPPKR